MEICYISGKELSSSKNEKCQEVTFQTQKIKKKLL